MDYNLVTVDYTLIVVISIFFVLIMLTIKEE